jgi:hypothetical protein
MAYRDSYSDPDEGDDAAAESDIDDRERPDPSDVDDPEDDGPESVPCPYCRTWISEDAELCPHCKSYISDEDAPRRHPWWLVAGVVVCLLIVLLWIL